MTEIAAIALFHNEGSLARATLASLHAAIGFARGAGLGVSAVLVLDRADAATRDLVHANAAGAQVIVTDFGDQSLARNAGIAACQGDWVALLDGDDLWAEDWLSAAYTFAQGLPDRGKTILHPEYNLIFGQEHRLLRQPDQSDPRFDPLSLQIGNAWDALCFAPRAAYLHHPFLPRDLKIGWGYEDWQWNLQTMAAGFTHRILPDSIVFKRRRQDSTTHRDRERHALPRMVVV